MSEPVFVSDLDGTLLRSDESISPEGRGKLTAMLDAGLNFTVATARSIVSVREVLKGLPLKLPVIEINGAFITDYESMHHYVVNSIGGEFLETLYGLIAGRGVYPFISTSNGDSDRLYHPRIDNEGQKEYYDYCVLKKDHRLRATDNLGSHFREQVVAFTVINRQEALAEIKEEIEERFAGEIVTHLFENPYSPTWWWLTIHDRNACKSLAVKKMVEISGLDFESLTVFGDNYNDYEMFRISPHAVAVANAPADLKALADEVIGDNNSGAVVDYISERFGV